jgi:TPR repeat protein
VKPHLNPVLAACAIGLLGPALPARSQDAAPAAQEISVVTVFGRLPKRVSPNIRRMDGRSASSCAFGFNSQRDQIMDDYLDSFQGKDRDNDGTEAEIVMEGDEPKPSAFSDTSTYGDARRDVARAEPNAEGRSDPCSQSDRNAAGGRNQIARKDKSLDQAFTAYDAQDYAKALPLFKEAYSRVGWDEAALMTGNMYLYGQGTARDTQQAIAWYTKLAQARLVDAHYSPFDPKAPQAATPRVEAQMMLAQIYMTGLDVPKDPKKARAWYQAAADLNHIPARFALARMLQAGYGGDKDIKQALKSYTSAAEYGYAPAQTALATLYQQGDAVTRNLETAFSWYQQAAFNPTPDRKKPHAQFALAQMYDEGRGVKADPDKALAFYRLAAVSGHPDAQSALGTYFYTGQIVKKDLPLARKLFLHAASQRQQDAMVNAAAMLFQGEGGERDLVQAYSWLRLAARLGHPKAPSMAAMLEKQLTPAQKAKADAVLAPN